jgi:acetyl-CoA carboxylase biotin carboxyl carrier protein
MSTSDQDQPQGHDQDEARGGAQQSHAPEGGAERGAGRHGGGGGGGRGGRRRGGGGGGGGRAPQQQQGQQHQQRRADSSLNMDELRELTELFTAHGLTDFEFENADIRVRLSRNPAPQAGASAAPEATPAPTSAPTPTAQPAPAPGTAATQAAPPETQQGAPAEAAEELHVITSPIVGTFYRAPSPQAEVFVRAGSRVEPDTTVCIIEAMKLMNEIQAETTGTVVKIYVENGQPVEYGQPLFGIKK